jgi:hypothetical protein
MSRSKKQPRQCVNCTRITIWSRRGMCSVCTQRERAVRDREYKAQRRSEWIAANTERLATLGQNPMEVAAQELEAIYKVPRERWIYATIYSSDRKMVEINERHVQRMRELAGISQVSHRPVHTDEELEERRKRAA